MSDEIETIDKNPKSWAAWKREAERLQGIIDGMALAAMDSEPVAFINGAWTLVYYRPPKESGLKIGDKLYRHAQQPVVLDSGREQFEEWFKFHDDGENSTEKLQRTNGGANYLYPDVDLAWIVWKDSRSALLQTAPAHLLPDKGHKGVTG